ncbi:MAG: hypothetical protein ABI221_01985 [Candidatus Saccharimonadales bacterium]
MGEFTQPQENGNHLRALFAVGAAATILGVGTAACGSEHSPVSSQNTTTAEATSSTTEAGAENNTALIEALTVKTTTVDCTDIVEKYGKDKVVDGRYVKFDIGALLPVDPTNTSMRKWSDAISTPFTSEQTDKKAMATELEAAICEDPELGVTVAHMFADLKVGETKIVDVNPWLKPYENDDSKINDGAAKFVPLMDVATPGKAQVNEAEKQNIAYQKLAAKLVTMLGRFQNTGVQTQETSVNYFLEAGGLVVAQLPEVGKNPEQYDATALTFTATRKTGGCYLEIGFNVGDKRPEVFKNCTNLTSTPPGKPPMTVTIPGGHTGTTSVETTIPGVSPKHDNGYVGPGTGRGTIPNTSPTPDHGQKNPVGGTVAGTTPETAAPGTTIRPSTPNTAPENTVPPAPKG